MKITAEMPAVQDCSVTQCAFNVNALCHAKAITIGDGMHPGCDTFMEGSPGHTHVAGTAGVGACKVSSCHYNDDLECMADGIHVAMAGGGANCTTFRAR